MAKLSVTVEVVDGDRREEVTDPAKAATAMLQTAGFLFHQLGLDESQWKKLTETSWETANLHPGATKFRKKGD